MATVLHVRGRIMVGADDIRPELWVVDGRVTFERPTGAGHEVQSVEGWVLPGLVDAHCHVGMDPEHGIDDTQAEPQAITDRDAGALLLTDWGPTEESWFRSGQAHKRAALRRLTEEFPHIRWLLVGDDGQHDPTLYDEIARARPDRVETIAIRQLTTAQQMLSSGTPLPADEPSGPSSVPVVEGPDGYVLHRLVTHAMRARQQVEEQAAEQSGPADQRTDQAERELEGADRA